MSDSPTYSDVYWSTIDGLQIVARQWTVASPRGGVLLIHGMGDHSGRYEHVAGFLNSAGFTVLAPDLRGHGRSEGRRGSIADFDILLEDTDLAVQQASMVAPQQPLFLYGHSFGGLLSIDFTLRRNPPLTGLIATSPSLRIAMATPAWKIAIAKTLGSLFPGLALPSGLDLNELSDDPQVASRARSDRLRHGKISSAAFFGMLDSGRCSLEKADQLECPTLILHGSGDKITDHRASIAFSEASRHCSLEIIEGARHELHNMSNRLEILGKITDFQSRCIHEDSPNRD